MCQRLGVASGTFDSMGRGKDTSLGQGCLRAHQCWWGRGRRLQQRGCEHASTRRVHPQQTSWVRGPCAPFPSGAPRRPSCHSCVCLPAHYTLRDIHTAALSSRHTENTERKFENRDDWEKEWMIEVAPNWQALSDPPQPTDHGT